MRHVLPRLLAVLTFSAGLCIAAHDALAQAGTDQTQQVGNPLQENQCKLFSGYVNAETGKFTPANGSLQPAGKTNNADACNDMCAKEEDGRIAELASPSAASNATAHTGIVTECWFGAEMLTQHVR